MASTYEHALELLNSRRAAPKERLTDMRGSDDMVKWLKLIGHSTTDIDNLNVIHIAGTNGKGSTCAFTAGLLTAFGKKNGWPLKVGLYTSPHLISIRERIQINGEWISEEAFGKAFFEVWNSLPLEATSSLDIPRYLQLLALVAFHFGIQENLDALVCETHLGGEYDATNIIAKPRVTGITMIGFDHVHLLGSTLEQITWHKSGIFKAGCPAFSAHQDDSVENALWSRAQEKGIQLRFVEIKPDLPLLSILKSTQQRQNCSLALEMTRKWLNISAQIDADIIHMGMEVFRLPGRYMACGNWFLDGAHNESSLEATAVWFNQMRNQRKKNCLVFGHFSPRKADTLLEKLLSTLDNYHASMDMLILTSYDESSNGIHSEKNLTKRFDIAVQEDCIKVWQKRYPARVIFQERTIKQAIARIEGSLDQDWQVLVTGSLHLVGGVLKLKDFLNESKSDTRM